MNSLDSQVGIFKLVTKELQDQYSWELGKTPIWVVPGPCTCVISLPRPVLIEKDGGKKGTTALELCHRASLLLWDLKLGDSFVSHREKWFCSGGAKF